MFKSRKSKIRFVVILLFVNAVGIAILLLFRMNALASFSINDTGSWRSSLSLDINLPDTITFKSLSEKAISHQWKIYEEGQSDTLFSNQPNFFRVFDRIGVFQVELWVQGKEEDDQVSKTLTLNLSYEHKERKTTAFEAAMKDYFSGSDQRETEFYNIIATYLSKQKNALSLNLSNGETLSLAKIWETINQDKLKSFEFTNYQFDAAGEISAVDIVFSLKKEPRRVAPIKRGTQLEEVIDDNEFTSKTGEGQVSSNLKAVIVIPMERIQVGDLLVGGNKSIDAVRYEWDFEDDGVIDSKDQNPSFRYSKVGNYTIKLKAYDKHGNQNVASQVIEVIEKVVAKFDLPKSKELYIDKPIVFRNNSSDQFTYRWDFGDGNTSTKRNPQHIYTAVGLYSISLEVTDKYGNKDRTKRKMQVKISMNLLSNKMTEIARVGNVYGDYETARINKATLLAKYFKLNKNIPVLENSTKIQLGNQDIESFLMELVQVKRTKQVLVSKVEVIYIGYDTEDGHIEKIQLNTTTNEG